MKTLAPHQILALDCMDTTNNLGLFYAPGTGKTIIALTWIRDALRSGRISSALVIAPASLVPNWEKDIEECTDFEHISEEDKQLLKENVVVRSYQKLYHSKKDPVTMRRRISLREDVDRLWGAIFVDESHGLGGHKSTQTKVCLTLAKMAGYRYIMTGTPVSGSTKSGGEALDKLYGQFKFLDPNIWPNWTAWCKKYVRAMDKFYQPTLFDVDALHKIMSEKAISVRLEDCVDLPEEIRTTIPCPLTEQKVYKEIHKGNTLPYGFEIKTAGGQFTKLLQLCSGSIKTESGTNLYKSSKDGALQDILEGTDDKVVIFCMYTASVDRCYKLAKEAGRDPVIFDGRSVGATWKQFVEGDKNVIITQYAAGGAGLNLQVSATMIMFEPCFSTRHLTQAFARIKRTGQRRVCNYYLFSTPASVESKVWESVLNGQDVIAETFIRWMKEGSI